MRGEKNRDRANIAGKPCSKCGGSVLVHDGTYQCVQCGKILAYPKQFRYGRNGQPYAPDPKKPRPLT